MQVPIISIIFMAIAFLSSFAAPLIAISWLRRKHTISLIPVLVGAAIALAYGIGHGGIEAIMLPGWDNFRYMIAGIALNRGDMDQASRCVAKHDTYIWRECGYRGNDCRLCGACLQKISKAY